VFYFGYILWTYFFMKKKKEIFSVRHNSALNVVLYDNIELPADKKQLTKVAELRFDGKLFLEHASSV